VEVIWHDAHGGDDGWGKLAAHHGKPAEVRTVGMLARQTKAGLIVVLSLDKRSGSYGAYVFVPSANVVSVKELE
jgi:hypothetical protein